MKLKYNERKRENKINGLRENRIERQYKNTCMYTIEREKARARERVSERK